MKIFICLFALILISCNQKVDINNNEIQRKEIILDDTISKTLEEIKLIDLPYNSNTLNYSKKDKNGYFIYDNSFKKQNYSKLSRIIGKYKNNDIEVYIVELKPNGDEHIEPIISLFSYSENKKIDSLIVYETIDWEGSLKKRFVINKDKSIKINEESEGNDETENGMDTLIVSNNVNIYNLSKSGFFTSNKWNGKYYFESKNKDNLKTSFEVSILDLNNITIKYIGDDEPVEVYKNLVAKNISSNKIKIIFNKKYEENGYINIEKADNEYYISGDLIYLINPGNDNLPLKKIN
ncbi:hypothetical protein [Flavobacterium sp.]|uniref:hypothetical protein n=1 Tax=Flavobacterium sp. TaxID=239 RepID=UPI00286E1A53|nr:hypothetical protein [Flavobacterium sp.]